MELCVEGCIYSENKFEKKKKFMYLNKIENLDSLTEFLFKD